MKVGVIQSNYLPWRGYFDFIDDVDLFIVYDDVQFSKGDWRNRNRIKTPQGPLWLTVPVHYRLGQRICDTAIDYSQRWTSLHLKQVRQNYAKAPFFADYADEFAELLEALYPSISDLNMTLMRWVMGHLAIETPLRRSSEFELKGMRTERLINVLKKVGASHYLSGPAAKAYLDEALFRESGIALGYKSYQYAPYPQLWGDFIGDVSVIDLLFNVGRGARAYLKSQAPHEAVIA